MAGNNVIYQWLDRIGLGYAIPHFQAQGVSTPQQLANLNLVDTADSLNIASADDKKRLWELIQRIKQASNKDTKVQQRSRDAGPPTSVAAQPPASPQKFPQQQAPLARVDSSADAGTFESAIGDGGYGPSRKSIAAALHSRQPSNPQLVRAASRPPAFGGIAEDDETQDDDEDGNNVDDDDESYGNNDEGDHSRARQPLTRPAADGGLPGSVSASAARAKAGIDRDGFEIKKQPKLGSGGIKVMPSQLAAMKKREEQAAKAAAEAAEAERFRKPRPSTAPVPRKPNPQSETTDSDGDDAADNNGYAAPPPPPARSAAVGRQSLAPSASGSNKGGSKVGNNSAGGGVVGSVRDLPHSPSGAKIVSRIGAGNQSIPSQQRADASSYNSEVDDDGNESYDSAGSYHAPLVQQPLRAAAAAAARPAMAPSHAPHPSSGVSVASWGLGSGIFDTSGPKIRVVVRKRPMNRKESSAKEFDVIKINTKRTMQVHEVKKKVDLTKYTEVHQFAFDDVFDESVSTEDVYRHTAQPLVGSIFNGGNATCFAYGQTGSGKTHTMMGNVKEGERLGDGYNDATLRSNPGLYVLAARDIFALLKSWEVRHDSNAANMNGGANGNGFPKKGAVRRAVVVSFFEIYGGKLFDLLNNRDDLKALVDARGDVFVKGLSERPVSGVEALLRVIDEGNRVRSTGSTGANDTSSRSHAVLQIVLADAVADGKGGIIPRIDNNTKRVLPVGKFSFIDLAGSERGADTMNNDKKTRLEGAEINKSLLALKECIRSLYQEADYNPFRGSKLTQVLKDSFMGNSRTVMIATISPNMSNTEHTLNTLRYAYRVKEIRRDDQDDVDIEAKHGRANDDEDESFQDAVAGGDNGISAFLARQASAKGVAMAAIPMTGGGSGAGMGPVRSQSQAGGMVYMPPVNEADEDGSHAAAADASYASIDDSVVANAGLGVVGRKAGPGGAAPRQSLAPQSSSAAVAPSAKKANSSVAAPARPSVGGAGANASSAGGASSAIARPSVGGAGVVRASSASAMKPALLSRVPSTSDSSVSGSNAAPRAAAAARPLKGAFDLKAAARNYVAAGGAPGAASASNKPPFVLPAAASHSSSVDGDDVEAEEVNDEDNLEYHNEDDDEDVNGTQLSAAEDSYDDASFQQQQQQRRAGGPHAQSASDHKSASPLRKPIGIPAAPASGSAASVGLASPSKRPGTAASASAGSSSSRQKASAAALDVDRSVISNNNSLLEASAIPHVDNSRMVHNGMLGDDLSIAGFGYGQAASSGRPATAPSSAAAQRSPIRVAGSSSGGKKMMPVSNSNVSLDSDVDASHVSDFRSALSPQRNAPPSASKNPHVMAVDLSGGRQGVASPAGRRITPAAGSASKSHHQQQVQDHFVEDLEYHEDEDDEAGVDDEASIEDEQRRGHDDEDGSANDNDDDDGFVDAEGHSALTPAKNLAASGVRRGQAATGKASAAALASSPVRTQGGAASMAVAKRTPDNHSSQSNNAGLMDSQIVRERARADRMRNASASVAGHPLNDTERRLVALHREQMEEMRMLAVQEQRLLELSVNGGGSAPSSPSTNGHSNHSGVNGGISHRGDMARYLSLLEDVLNRKFVLITDLMRTCDEYKSRFGKEVGLVDPLENSSNNSGSGEAANNSAGGGSAGAIGDEQHDGYGYGGGNEELKEEDLSVASFRGRNVSAVSQVSAVGVSAGGRRYIAGAAQAPSPGLEYSRR